VIGVALAARAALELEASAGIRSTTLARLLAQLDDNCDGSPLRPGSVLVVDEAGMIGTRQLARLLDHAEQQSVKVVLVGDPRQLPEIDAGGLFRALTTRLPAIELTDNRRQAHTWEQAALDELRHGDPGTALAAYRQHGRIHTADTAEAVRHRLVDDWWTTASRDLPGSIMIALRRDDVEELNRRARSKMLEVGRLTGPTVVTTGGLDLRAGDRIVCLRNDRRLGVVNGTRATITRVDVARRALEAVDDRGEQLVLPADYLDAGHVAHGYAITGHKAQGLTCDHTYTLGTETLYREWGYVAMSRGRLSNQLYHGPGGDRDDDGLHHHVHLQDDVPDLASRMRRSRAETPVSPALIDVATAWQDLVARLDQFELPALREMHHAVDQLDERRDRLADTVERLQQRLADEPRGGLLRLRRRGVVHELEAELERAAASLTDVTQRLATAKASTAGLPDRHELVELVNRQASLDAELRQAAVVRVRGYWPGPPGYLTSALGTPPTDAVVRNRWERTAVDIEHHRLRWQIMDPRNAFGSGVVSRRMQQASFALRDEIERTVEDLARGPVRQCSLTRTR
jgi:hypothetical protein